MIGQINQKGYTLIPLKVYFSGSLVKFRSDYAKVRNSTTNDKISQREIS